MPSGRESLATSTMTSASSSPRCPSRSAFKRRVDIASPDEEIRAGIASIQQRVGTLVESVRVISHDLHPDVLKHGGLPLVLADHCAKLSAAQAWR
jgi:signal transduction histidine kinase